MDPNYVATSSGLSLAHISLAARLSGCAAATNMIDRGNKKSLEDIDNPKVRAVDSDDVIFHLAAIIHRLIDMQLINFSAISAGVSVIILMRILLAQRFCIDPYLLKLPIGCPEL